MRHYTLRKKSSGRQSTCKCPAAWPSRLQLIHTRFNGHQHIHPFSNMYTVSFTHSHAHTKILRRDAPHRVASRTSKSRLSALHNDHHQPPSRGNSLLLYFGLCQPPFILQQWQCQYSNSNSSTKFSSQSLLKATSQYLRSCFHHFSLGLATA